MKVKLTLGMGFPVDPQRRIALEAMAGRPIPVYADSKILPCSMCGEPTIFGPMVHDKILAKECQGACIECVTALQREQGTDIKPTCLGNTPLNQYEYDALGPPPPCPHCNPDKE